MENVVWKKIKGFEKYEVSNTGLVRSLRFNPPRIMSPKKMATGHLRIALGRGKQFSIHRLVLETFVCQPPTKKHECHHINNIPFDNVVENLKWVSGPSHKIEHSGNGYIKTPWGTWIVRIRRKGKSYSFGSFKTEPEAYAMHEEVMGWIGSGNKIKDFYVIKERIEKVHRPPKAWVRFGAWRSFHKIVSKTKTTHSTLCGKTYNVSPREKLPMRQIDPVSRCEDCRRKQIEARWENDAKRKQQKSA